jgi:hypothetical protein
MDYSGMNQANAAQQADMSGMNQIFQTLSGLFNKDSSAYFGQGGGASALQGLTGAGGNALTSAISSGWNGLKPQELNALQTTMSNNNASNIATERGDMGGIANPNASLQAQANSGQQANMNLGAQLGSMAQQQDLGYLGMLSSDVLGAAGQQGNQLMNSSGQLQGMGNTYGQMASAAGNQAMQYGQGMVNNINSFGSNLGGTFTGGAAGSGGLGSMLMKGA